MKSFIPVIDTALLQFAAPPPAETAACAPPLAVLGQRYSVRKPVRTEPFPRLIARTGLTPSFSAQRAFTLVELLIVIIIIGILAAVAIPQFGSSSANAKLAALDQNLASVRSSIDLYYQQHNNAYPGIVATHKTGASGTPAAHASTADAFTRQLTMYSDASGNTSDTMSTSFPYGPYLRRGIPANPLPVTVVTGTDAAVVSVVTSTSPLTADNSPTTGWKASSATGEFISNNSANSSR